MEGFLARGFLAVALWAGDAGRDLDGRRHLGAGLGIGRRDVEDAFRRDVEDRLDAHLPSGARTDAGEDEVAEQLVVLGLLLLALIDAKVQRRLVVDARRELAALVVRDRGVLLEDRDEGSVRGA